MQKQRFILTLRCGLIFLAAWLQALAHGQNYPVIVQEPQSNSVVAGATATFTVSSSGHTPLSYFWHFNSTSLTNGGRISGADTNQLSISNVVSGDAGGYWVLVTNRYGQATSTVATLNVLLPPSITQDPQGQTVVIGTNVTLTASASGSGTLVYNWQQNGTNLVDGGRISGSTTPTLTISGVLGVDSGSYHLVVTNAVGSATSAEAVVSVVPILGWGYNVYGQATAPAGATRLMGLDVGEQHALALRGDGTLVTWGYTNFGLSNIPAEATNIVAIATGSYHDLALRADGTVLAWGKNDAGESVVPPNTTNVVALAGGYSHSLALRADGTVIGWGDNVFNETTIPAAATNVVAIDAGGSFSLALKADGSVVAWGIDQDGEIDVPANASNIVAIAAGQSHSLALGADGTLFTWGSSFSNSTTIPLGLSNVTAIACGDWDNLAILSDGSPTGWGYNFYGQASPPASVTNPAAILAGGYFSLAWLRDPTTGVPPGFWLQSPSESLVGGQPLFLYPGLSGTPPLRFQWYFNNAPLSGQTNRWLCLTNSNPTQGGGYSLVAANDFGSATSTVATVSIQAIQFTTQPTNLTVRMNEMVTLSAAAGGTAALAYRWQKDGQDLSDTNQTSGSVTPSLTISYSQPSDSGNYQLVVTNAYGAATSAVAVVTVLAPRPLLNVDFGPNVVSAKTGPAAIGQVAGDFWNGYNFGNPGISNLALADGAATAVSVVTSNAANWAWDFWTDPMLHNAFIQFGSPITVSVFGLPPGLYDFYIYGDGPYYVEWEEGWDFELLVGGVSVGRNSVYAPAADAPPFQENLHYLAFHNVQVGAPGTPVVIISRPVLGQNANIAGLQIGQFLTSNSPPVFWSQPISQYVPIGTNLVLNATAGGFPDPARQWFFNNAVVTNDVRTGGANADSLTISNVQFADTGTYYSVITNTSGVVTSAMASVVVGIPPTANSAPGNQTWIAGTTGLLPASVTGTDPLSYQWYLGTNQLVDSAHLSGTASSSLTVSNVAPSDAGTYSLVVTNLFGTLTVTAAVSVVVPPAFGKPIAGYSVPVGLPVTLSAIVSGTAPLSYQWLLNGTNVPGATSNSLRYAALAPENFGNYQLVISNYASAVTSGVAPLTIGPVATWAGGTSLFGTGVSVPIWPGPGLSNVIAIAGGSGYSLALRSDGTVYGWGSNPATNVPAGLSGVVGIAAGANHALAVRSDGSVVAWGLDSSGQTNVPAGLSNVVSVAAGSAHSAALRADGTVVAWGGLTVQNQTNLPAGLFNVAAIDAGGSETLALREDGTVSAWGGESTAPPFIPPYLSEVSAISASSAPNGYNLALLADGTVMSWNNGGVATNIPTVVTNVLGIKAAGGADQSTGFGVVVCSNGSVFAWGAQRSGPTNVPPGVSNCVAVSGGANHILALLNDGRPLIVSPPVGGTFSTGAPFKLQAVVQGNSPMVLQWLKDGMVVSGANDSTLIIPAAQMSDAGNYSLVASNSLGVAQSLPAPVTLLDAAPVLMSQPAGGYAYQGSPCSVGASVIGSGPMQLSWSKDGVPIANGTNELVFERAAPQQGGTYQLSASNPFGSVTSSNAQLIFSRLAAWGAGPSLSNASVDLGSIVGMASGYTHALAIRGDGTVAAWGSVLVTNVPPGLSNVVAVSGGNMFSVALLADGTAAAWGLGTSGQTNVPTGLSHVVAISAGASHTLALRADGTVAAWGTIVSAVTNVPAGLSNVVAIAAGASHSLALKDDGTVVAWGAAGTMPVLSNIVSIAAGYNQSLALRADGTVLGWTSAKAPAPPVGLSNVVAISSGGGYEGFYLDLALLADGTVAAWGGGSYGMINVPSGLTSAVALSAGSGSSLALLNDRSPAMTVQPWSRRVPSGTNVTLTGFAVGQAPLSYQWYRNGLLVPGATNNSLAFTPTQPNQSGDYQLVVGNNLGTVTSAFATLTVSVPPVTLQPLTAGANGFTFSFTSLAGVIYIVEYSDNLAAGIWTELERRLGVGGLEIVTDASAGPLMRFYRVRALYAPAPRLGGFVAANGAVRFSVPTVSGALYVVQYKDHLDDPVWSELSRQTGTGQPILVTDPNPSGPTRFYRVQVQ